ncbi:MAG TPA: TetR/AcrR family transcriptional regulator [Glycomyces sp.]|nr:TetR/AcrR family transcriptional regulator [Glycomyces sp.]
MDWLLEAAAQLFHEHGYTATTTNKVAERAGISVGSVYQYFPNKDALLAALAERHLNEAAAVALAALGRAAAAEASLRTVLHELIASLVELHAARPGLHSLLVRYSLAHPDVADTVRALEGEVAAALAVELRRLGVGGDRAERRALLAVEGANAHLHGTLLRPPSGVARESMVEEVVDLWTAALSRGRE